MIALLSIVFVLGIGSSPYERCLVKRAKWFQKTEHHLFEFYRFKKTRGLHQICGSAHGTNLTPSLLEADMLIGFGDYFRGLHQYTFLFEHSTESKTRALLLSRLLVVHHLMSISQHFGKFSSIQFKYRDALKRSKHQIKKLNPKDRLYINRMTKLLTESDHQAYKKKTMPHIWSYLWFVRTPVSCSKITYHWF